VRPVALVALPEDTDVPLFALLTGLDAVPVTLSGALLSLIDGVVLETVVLFADTLVGVDDAVADPALPADVLLTDVLPDEGVLTAVDAVRPADSFLLTVLLLPMPPLSDDVPAKSLSEPVWCLDPYHTSL
jgi:hypothetical protein